MIEKEDTLKREEEVASINKVEMEEQKEKLLRLSEISLWLDTYDDIFSDFDPRPYSQRALSDDFLNEAKRASKEKTSGKIELKFLVPSNMRKLEKESIIKKRLREHFKKHMGMIHDEVSGIRRKGVIATATGFLMMITAILIKEMNLAPLASDIFSVLFEPGGWFMMWFGLDQFFYTTKEKDPDLEFYDKMSKSDITFTSY